MPFVLLEVRFLGSPRTLTIQIMAQTANQARLEILLGARPKSQNEQIIEYLLEGNEITPIDALNLFGCFRLGARIYDLREMGYPIEMKARTTCTNGVHKRFAVYYIEPIEIARLKSEGE